MIPLASAPTIRTVISGTIIGFQYCFRRLIKIKLPLICMTIEKIKNIAEKITKTKFTKRKLSINSLNFIFDRKLII